MPKTIYVRITLSLVALLCAGDTNLPISASRTKGTMIVSGLGFVDHLNGKGDGEDYPPLYRAAQARFANKTFGRDEYKSMAIVEISAIVTVDWFSGRRIKSVTIWPIGPATSLDGGRLLRTELVDPLGQPIVFVSGELAPNFHHETWKPKGAAIFVR